MPKKLLDSIISSTHRNSLSFLSFCSTLTRLDDSERKEILASVRGDLWPDAERVLGLVYANDRCKSRVEEPLDANAADAVNAARLEAIWPLIGSLDVTAEGAELLVSQPWADDNFFGDLRHLTLRFDSASIFSDALHPLFQNLHTLRIEFQDVTHDVLERIGAGEVCPSVSKLCVSWFGRSRFPTSHLVQLLQTKYPNVVEMQVAAGPNTNWEQLGVCDADLRVITHSDGLKGLRAIADRIISLSVQASDDLAAVDFEPFSNVNSIHLRFPPSRPTNAFNLCSALRNFEKIDDLHVGNLDFPRFDCSADFECKRIRFENCRLSKAVIDATVSSKLQSLALRGCDNSQLICHAKDRLVELREIQIGPHPSDTMEKSILDGHEISEILDAAAQLERIDIEQPIPNKVVLNACKPRIHELSLRGFCIGPDVADYLIECPFENLRELSFRSKNWTSQTWRAFWRAKWIERLWSLDIGGEAASWPEVSIPSTASFVAISPRLQEAKWKNEIPTLISGASTPELIFDRAIWRDIGSQTWVNPSQRRRLTIEEAVGEEAISDETLMSHLRRTTDSLRDDGVEIRVSRDESEDQCDCFVLRFYREGQLRYETSTSYESGAFSIEDLCFQVETDVKEIIQCATETGEFEPGYPL